jgi:sugar lactone lactonase YvrE
MKLDSKFHAIRHLLLIAAAACLPAAVAAHPGSGIVVDRAGQVYFVDMVSGVWRLDRRLALTHLPGPAFHWMTADEDDRLSAVRLPSGASGDVVRLGAHPTLLLASDFPIAMGPDGSLYFPSHASADPLRMLKLSRTGETSTFARLPAASGGPRRDVNGVASGPDGTVFYTEDDAIRRISREGIVSTVLSMTSCPSRPQAGSPRPPMLRGLAVDSTGAAYVAATGCGAVLKVFSAGTVTVLPQVPNAWAPTGIALFGGDLYVLEFQDANAEDRQAMLPRVRRIRADGTTAVIATVTQHR